MSKSFSIIISNNLRSLEYLNVFKKLNLEPEKIIYVNDNRNSLIKKKIIRDLNKNQIFNNKKIFFTQKFSEKIIKYLLKEKKKILFYPFLIVKLLKINSC